MPDYRSLFKSCGTNVEIAPDVHIEHPDVMEVGNNVRFMKGFYMQDRPQVCRIGDNVTFYPYCFVQGSAGLFEIEHDVDFLPYNYISLGKWDSSFVKVGHDSHFAPQCVLYGWGGLTIGPFCNIAAHTVLATVGHHAEITDIPMSLSGEKAGPITLEEDIWLAANVTVCANVKIARGCVVAANAVVTRDTEPMGMYAGVPARRLCKRGEVASFTGELYEELQQYAQNRGKRHPLRLREIAPEGIPNRRPASTDLAGQSESDPTHS